MLICSHEYNSIRRNAPSPKDYTKLASSVRIRAVVAYLFANIRSTTVNITALETQSNARPSTELVPKGAIAP